KGHVIGGQAQKMLPEDEVTRRRDRQELSEALDKPKKYCFPPGHLILVVCLLDSSIRNWRGERYLRAPTVASVSIRQPGLNDQNLFAFDANGTRLRASRFRDVLASRYGHGYEVAAAGLAKIGRDRRCRFQDLRTGLRVAVRLPQHGMRAGDSARVHPQIVFLCMMEGERVILPRVAANPHFIPAGKLEASKGYAIGLAPAIRKDAGEFLRVPLAIRLQLSEACDVRPELLQEVLYLIGLFRDRI